LINRTWGYRVWIGLLVIVLGLGTLAAPAIALPSAILPGAAILAQTTVEAVTDDDTNVAAADGAQIFEINCAGCHANGGNIIRRGKNLRMRALQRYHMDTVEAIAHIVSNGKRPMSAYKDTLTSEEIQAVSAYVLKRAEEDWQ